MSRLPHSGLAWLVDQQLPKLRGAQFKLAAYFYRHLRRQPELMIRIKDLAKAVGLSVKGTQNAADDLIERNLIICATGGRGSTKTYRLPAPAAPPAKKAKPAKPRRKRSVGAKAKTKPVAASAPAVSQPGNAKTKIHAKKSAALAEPARNIIDVIEHMKWEEAADAATPPKP